MRNPIFLALSYSLCCSVPLTIDVSAQRKRKKKTPAAPVSELAKLREEFVKATNEYKASLEKLVPLYEADVKRAEDKLAVSQKLLAEGLDRKSAG